MKLFDGKKAARKILKETENEIKKKKRNRPALAVILVGDDPASKLYIKLKKEAGAKIGIKVQEYLFAAGTKEEEIITKIKILNEDKKTHGIIVQLPLPAMLNPDRVISAISPKKDVDGFQKENKRFSLIKEKEEPRFSPVLPRAILIALDEALKNDLKDKKIVALVNSDVFGQSLKTALEKEGAQINCLVRKACVIMGVHNEVKEADVLISVCGCPRFIKGDMIKDGVILIDAGITRYSDGKVVGDIDSESVKTKAAFLTPVPGGVGPLTVALLLKNVYLAAKLSLAKPS
ncbi:MAG: bifunctional 5,10-methylenetetrahydrofolate dehydrogenase/5,10-methenyltetrahydrofolate cyclohydrolase [bacterium]|nr:bifunctional 5,10-methylenetetrahydrofolate dehydrogenase/5,10-methenyltetrahydrofolate cyclohydrolase [bacterium]